MAEHSLGLGLLLQPLVGQDRLCVLRRFHTFTFFCTSPNANFFSNLCLLNQLHNDVAMKCQRYHIEARQLELHPVSCMVLHSMCACFQAVWEPVEAGTESAAARGAYTCHLLTPEMLVPKLFGE